METRTIELATPDGPMAVYEAVPEETDGAVIVVQEAFGVNDHIEDVTRRFAAEGYHAVAPYFFHRSGGGTAPYGDFSKVLPHYEKLDDERILVDVDATREHLREAGHDERRVGIVGFCFGGRVTFLVAVERELGAGVGFYGGGIVSERSPAFPSLLPKADRLATPWLGLFGDEDQSIPVGDVERLREALQGLDTPSEIVRYPDAGHGFHCDDRDSYHEPSARDGWRRTLEWFERYLRSG